MEKPKFLPTCFFLDDVKIVAQNLLGKTMCVRGGKGRIDRVVISETEAYDGEKDLACHASKGKTLRTSTMYMEGGVCYVYLCYGIHWMLNIVAREVGYPAAVLIRGSLEIGGPGRLTKALGINGSFNGVNLCPHSSIWLEDSKIKPSEIHQGPRIGVEYSGPVWSKKPYRFWFSKY